MTKEQEIKGINMFISFNKLIIVHIFIIILTLPNKLILP